MLDNQKVAKLRKIKLKAMAQTLSNLITYTKIPLFRKDIVS